MIKYLKYIILVIFIIIVIILAISPINKFFSIEQSTKLINSIQNNPFASLIFIIIYISGVVLALPGTALTVIAAPIFGFWQGLFLVIIASNIGASITFFISRFLGDVFFRKFIKTDSKFANLSSKIENNGFLVVLYLRLLPFFPFNAINYLSGLTKLRYRDYYLATLLGMFPATLVYVYFSYTAADIKNNPYGILISIGVLILFTFLNRYYKKKNIFKFDEDKNDWF